MWCRGIRGATTCENNTKEEIVAATRELLQKIVESNGISIEDIGAINFTTTTDLTAEFPAVAARELGWTDLALLCGHEMNVAGALPRCVRVLMLVNTERTARELVHVYIKEAVKLKPQNPK